MSNFHFTVQEATDLFMCELTIMPLCDEERIHWQEEFEKWELWKNLEFRKMELLD